MATQAEWLKCRAVFLIGKRNHEGYYICEGVDEPCGKWIVYPEVDHILTRGSHPELILVHSNLRILCFECHRKRHAASDNSVGPQPELLGDSDYDPDNIINYF